MSKQIYLPAFHLAPMSSTLSPSKEGYCFHGALSSEYSIIFVTVKNYFLIIWPDKLMKHISSGLSNNSFLSISTSPIFSYNLFCYSSGLSPSAEPLSIPFSTANRASIAKDRSNCSVFTWDSPYDYILSPYSSMSSKALGNWVPCCSSLPSCCALYSHFRRLWLLSAHAVQSPALAPFCVIPASWNAHFLLPCKVELKITSHLMVSWTLLYYSSFQRNFSSSLAPMVICLDPY